MKANLATTYLGLNLANPVVVSACPLTGELDVLRRLEANGAAAAVLPSMFEEQLEEQPHDYAQLAATPGAGPLVESLAYFHELKDYNRGPEAYLKYIENAKRSASIPLIGSLNVTAPGEWLRWASKIEAAGADALELNIFFLPADFDTTAREVEARYVELVAAVRHEISIPLAVKIGQNFTAFPNLARRLVEAGADGLVLFNRYLQPDIDLNALRVVPKLALSTSDELRGPLRWIALLAGRLDASLAATTGIHSAEDALKMLLAGADVVMVASLLYQQGIDALRPLVEDIDAWLAANDWQSVEQIKGRLSQRRCPDPAAFERANYTKALSSFTQGGHESTVRR